MASWSDAKGLTLIETLIALVVFSLGMLGVAGLTIIVIRGNTLSQQLTAATLLAQDKLESIYGTDYADVADEHEVVTTDNRRQYIRTVEITEDAPALGMKIVSITVRWAQSDTPDHQVLLKTIVFGR